jgi:hypothetical protein
VELAGPGRNYGGPARHELHIHSAEDPGGNRWGATWTGTRLFRRIASKISTAVAAESEREVMKSMADGCVTPQYTVVLHIGDCVQTLI